MSEPLSPEGRAARLVVIAKHLGDGRHDVLFRQHVCDTFAYREDADADAESLRAEVAAALREHEQALFAWAMADGPKRPVTENVEEAIRLWVGRRHADVGSYPRDLLTLLEHAREETRHALARLAHLANDTDGRGWLREGEKIGWAKARAACVKELNDQYMQGNLLYDAVGCIEAVPEPLPEG